MYRWVHKGVRGVKLEVLFIPSGTVTSEAACQRFRLEVDRAKRAALVADAPDVTPSQLKAAGLLGGKQ